MTHIPTLEDLYCLPIMLRLKREVLIIKVHKTFRGPSLKYSLRAFALAIPFAWNTVLQRSTWIAPSLPVGLCLITLSK